MLFLTLRRGENNEKLKLSSTNKTHVYSLLVTFDVLRLYVVTEKSEFLCAIFRILIHSDPKILQISILQPFLKPGRQFTRFFNSEKISNENEFSFKLQKIFKGILLYYQEILHHKTQLKNIS